MDTEDLIKMNLLYYKILILEISVFTEVWSGSIGLGKVFQLLCTF